MYGAQMLAYSTANVIHTNVFVYSLLATHTHIHTHTRARGTRMWRMALWWHFFSAMCSYEWYLPCTIRWFCCGGGWIKSGYSVWSNSESEQQQQEWSNAITHAFAKKLVFKLCRKKNVYLMLHFCYNNLCFLFSRPFVRTKLATELLLLPITPKFTNAQAKWIEIIFF